MRDDPVADRTAHRTAHRTAGRTTGRSAGAGYSYSVPPLRVRYAPLTTFAIARPPNSAL